MAFQSTVQRPCSRPKEGRLHCEGGSATIASVHYEGVTNVCEFVSFVIVQSASSGVISWSMGGFYLAPPFVG